MKTISQLWQIIDKKLRGYFIILLIFGSIVSFIEVISIASIVPFLTLLLSPEQYSTLPCLKYFPFLKTVSDNQFIVGFIIFIPTIFILKNIILLFTQWKKVKIAEKIKNNLSLKLFKNYLNFPLKLYKKNNRIILLYKINNFPNIVYELVIKVINIFVSLLLIISLMILLLFFSPPYIVILLFTSMILSSFFLKFSQNKMEKIGENINKTNYKLNLTINHALGNIKLTKIKNSEDFFIKEFNSHLKIMEELYGKNEIFLSLPKFLLEIIIILTLSILLFYMIKSGYSNENIVIKLSFITISVYRIINLMKEVLFSLSFINYGNKIVGELSDDLEENITDKTIENNLPEIKFNNILELRNISFSHSIDKKIFENFNFTIARNSSTLILGPSGCGKSTLLNLISGLLKVESGEISVDGINIEKNIKKWQKKIGYLPQDIFLIDDTIKKNIAFGEKDIDEEKIWKCLEIANIKKDIEILKHKLDTKIGENGFKLSGGEKQRIAIARALYTSPELLIMDEPLNSLDIESETLILESIKKLSNSRRLTIIIVSHKKYMENLFDNIITLKKEFKHSSEE